MTRQPPQGHDFERDWDEVQDILAAFHAVGFIVIFALGWWLLMSLLGNFLGALVGAAIVTAIARHYYLKTFYPDPRSRPRR